MIFEILTSLDPGVKFRKSDDPMRAYMFSTATVETGALYTDCSTSYRQWPAVSTASLAMRLPEQKDAHTTPDGVDLQYISDTT
jgi:hypothetical protein